MPNLNDFLQLTIEELQNLYFSLSWTKEFSVDKKIQIIDRLIELKSTNT